MEKQQNKRSFSKSRRDGASVFAIIFALLFIAMGVRGFLGAGSVFPAGKGRGLKESEENKNAEGREMLRGEKG